VIICQHPPPSDAAADADLLTAKDFIRFLRKRRTVRLLPLEEVAAEGFRLEARADRSLATLASAVASKLGVSAQRVLLTGALVDETVTPPTTRPRNVPHHFAHSESLKRAADVARCAQDVLFYELLPEGVSRERLASGHAVRVRVYVREHAYESRSQMRAVTLCASRDDTLRTLLSPLSLEGELRVLAVRDGRVLTTYSLNQRCADLDANALLNADTYWLVDRPTTPAAEGGISLACSHARPMSSHMSLTVKCWGLPFFVPLAPRDSVAELAERVRSALNVNKGEFLTWKIAQFDAVRDNLEHISNMDSAIAQSTEGSAWALWSPKGGLTLALLHHPPERPDAHARSVKIQ
jgi:hypothetical protein